jgi:hypothetical protein
VRTVPGKQSKRPVAYGQSDNGKVVPGRMVENGGIEILF